MEDNQQIKNVIIIGSGPAAHTAAIYLGRANQKPILLEGDSTGNIIAGGLLTTTKTVENFPGFPDGIDGYDLTQRFRQQSQNCGTEIVSEDCVGLKKINTDNFNIFKVLLKNGNFYITKAVLIATGSSPKLLDCKGFNKYWGNGISSCAVCDGFLPCFRDVPIAVVGGGDSACEEALYLSNTAQKIYLIHRGEKLRASKVMQERVFNNKKIQIIWNSIIEEIKGEKFIQGLLIYDKIQQTKQTISIKGLFVAIGHTPNSYLFKDIVDTDDDGYIITQKDMSTSQKGIWACGDVQDKKYKQAVTAAGSGCIASLEIERYLQQQ